MSEQLERFFHGRRTQHQPVSPASITLLSGPPFWSPSLSVIPSNVWPAPTFSSNLFRCGAAARPPFCSSSPTTLRHPWARRGSLVSCSSPGVCVLKRTRRVSPGHPHFTSNPHPRGIDPSSDVFRRIQIKYVDDDEGLRKYFAAFHLLETVPASVIVDDFGELFDVRSCQEKYANHREQDMAMVRTLALCHNTIAHANKTSPCELLLADVQHGDSPRLLYIYKRWVSSILTIRGDGCGSFFLRSEVHAKSGRRIAAKYSIALHYLLLDEITDDPLE